MRLVDMEKADKTYIREHIDCCFELAEEAESDDRRSIHLTEADFYMRELERRRDQRTSRRDLILEIVVIALIGWEIFMNYRAEHLQGANFKEEKQVFENLQKSSKATADTLVAVKDTMGSMKLSLEKQVELFYDVQVNVVYQEGTKKLVLINNGRANVTLWAHRIGLENAQMIQYHKPIVVTPGGTWELGLDSSVKQLSEGLPKGANETFLFRFFVKNEKQDQFTVRGQLIADWHGDSVYFETHPQGIVPGWKK